MSKLLYAGFRRYFKSLLFWLALVASVVLGIISGIRAKEDYMLEDVYSLAGFVIYAILLSLMIGTEFGDGAIRNKIVTGHTKGIIFVSEYVVSVAVCLFLGAVSAAVFAVFNTSVFGRIPTELLVKSVIGVFWLVVSMISVTVCLGMLISHRAIIPIAAIVLIIISCFAVYGIEEQLNIPEYQIKFEKTDDGLWYGNYTNEKNPEYIDGPLRDIYTFLYRIMPHGQIREYLNMTGALFDPINISLSVPEEDSKILNALPFYSIGTIFVFTALGYVGFSKKQLK